ncbi:MAG: RecX family transcriptional regulator [bacterium]
MPFITKISLQKKKGRYNVEIDEQFAFGVSEVLLAREGLYKGKELSLGQVEALRQASEEDKLYEKALGFLSYRPRSRREVEIYLKRKVGKCSNTNSISNSNSNPNNCTGGVLARLEKQSYINDTSFARWWVEQRQGGKNPKGPAIIKAELYQKGVAREVIEKAMEPVGSSKDLVEQAGKARAARLKGLDKVAFKRRLSSYLLRRGFLWEDVKPVVDELSR